MAGEETSSIRSSRTTLESDKNKPLPDPKAGAGLDLDRTTNGAPKVEQKKPKLKKVNEQIKPPELTYIPKLLPIFVELLSDNLTQIVNRG